MSATINRRNLPAAIGWMLLFMASVCTGLNALQPPVDLLEPLPAENAADLQQPAAGEHGFALASGSWQFPELNWTISQQLTTATPADWFQQHYYAAGLGGSPPRHPHPRISPETELDAQIIALVRSLMLPATTQGDWNIYKIDSDSLRGLAISSASDGSEHLLAICLQWPAETGRWTQLEMQRLPTCASIRPATELPPGTKVTAQRSGRDGQVQVQVLHLSQTPNDLQQHLKQHSWTITKHPCDESIFWAGNDGKLLEFTCQSLPSGQHTALMRNLDQTQPMRMQVGEEF